MKSGNFDAMSPTQWLRAKGQQLLSIKDTAHAVALGMAIGMFFGLVPLWGLKTLLALGIARLLNANLVAAAIAVTLHDAILPLLPLLLRWEYQIGYWLLSHPHELPPRMRFSHQKPSVWFNWSTFLTIGRPLLVGSAVLAAPVSVVTYFLSFHLVERLRRRPASPLSESNRSENLQ